MNPAAKALLRTVLLPIAPIWDPPYTRWVQRRQQFDRPIPPITLRRRVGGTGANASSFVESGRLDSKVFIDAIARLKHGDLRRTRVLDFGAGIGRLLCHLDGLFGEVHATDVDRVAVNYLRSAFPRVKAEVNELSPPLRYPDGMFDLVYSFSVWTHLDESDQVRWLEEIRRILKPGGHLLASANGMTALDFDVPPGDRATASASLRERGFYFSGYSGTRAEGLKTDLPKGMDRRYGCTIQTSDHLRRAWGAVMEVVEIREAAFRRQQDLVVLRKRD